MGPIDAETAAGGGCDPSAGLAAPLEVTHGGAAGDDGSETAGSTRGVRYTFMGLDAAEWREVGDGEGWLNPWTGYPLTMSDLTLGLRLMLERLDASDDV